MINRQFLRQFLLSLCILVFTVSSSYSAEILCKKDGKIYNALLNENKDTCFESLYWGGVCYRGKLEESSKVLSKSLPLKTKFQALNYFGSTINSISYTATDLRINVSEVMTITACSRQFLR